jgi:Ice-binding-like
MKLFKNYAAVASLALLGTLAYTGNALAGPGNVGLGTDTSFAVLAHTGVTDTPGTPSTINGDLGNDQNIPTTGNPTLNGTSHINDGVAAGARADLNTAYGDAAGRTPSTTLVGLAVPGDNQLGGRTLVAGVYNFAHATTANLTGVLTLSGSSSDVWIFQAASDLVTSTTSSVNFIGGASPATSSGRFRPRRRSTARASPELSWPSSRSRSAPT